MERSSRAELIATVNTQRDQLLHYKQKLRDVVAAYKSVQAEKDALEASLSALSTAVPTGQVEGEGSGEGQTEVKDGNTVDSASADSQGASTQEGEECMDTPDQESKDPATALREQIKTLSISLTTLTQEKNRLEANFIADKKQLRTDNEELQSKLSEERKSTSTQAEGFELQITDLKSKLRTYQLDREKEQTDNALMMRELQTLLSTERMVKEAIEGKLEECQKSLKETQEKVKREKQEAVAEAQMLELQKELATLRDRLKEAEVKANTPSPLLLELQKEMSHMKSSYQHQVAAEQHKAVEAEARLRVQAKQAEERVSGLEGRLSELSQEVGNYESLRCQDQTAISRLRERVSQLDMENSALARAATIHSDKAEEGEGHNPEKLVERIMQLRSQLKSALAKKEGDNRSDNISLAAIFVDDMNKADEESPQCRQYKEELETVREEFERYKLRAQSVLKNKTAKDSGQSRETELLKEQVAELRDKLRMNNFHFQEEVAQYQQKTDNLSKALLAQEEKARSEVTQLKATHQSELAELEVESRKQRQRTVALLAEKDSEIQELRARGYHGYESETLRSSWEDGAGQQDGSKQRRQSTEEMEAVARLMNLPAGVKNEAAFLHFAQEKGRMEVEINTLRKQKRQLELTHRDLQASTRGDKEQLEQQVFHLQERLAEVSRSDQRETANVEYIKNVLYKFLTSTADISGKKQMTKALMTILQFSPEEKSKVDHVHARGWWSS